VWKVLRPKTWGGSPATNAMGLCFGKLHGGSVKKIADRTSW